MLMFWVSRAHLQRVDHLAHVSFADLHDVVDGFVGDLDLLGLADLLESARSVFFGDLSELEARGSRLQRGDHFGDLRHLRVRSCRSCRSAWSWSTSP